MSITVKFSTSIIVSLVNLLKTNRDAVGGIMKDISSESLEQLWYTEPLLAMYSFDDKYDPSLNIHKDQVTVVHIMILRKYLYDTDIRSVLLDRLRDAISKVREEHLIYIMERIAVLSTKLPHIYELFQKFEPFCVLHQTLSDRGMGKVFDKFVAKYITVTNTNHCIDRMFNGSLCITASILELLDPAFLQGSLKGRGQTPDYELISDWMVSTPLRLRTFGDSIVDEHAIVTAMENDDYTSIICNMSRKTVKSILSYIKREPEGLFKDWLAPLPSNDTLGQVLRLFSIYNETSELVLIPIIKEKLTSCTSVDGFNVKLAIEYCDTLLSE